MRRTILVAAVAVFATVGAMRAQELSWTGKWYSSRGEISFEQKGAIVTGRYGESRQHRIVGKFDGGVLTAKFAEGAIAGDVIFRRVEGERLLRGRLTVGLYHESWFAWQKDPKGGKGRAVKVAGPWRSSLGVFKLKQRGSRISGILGTGDGKKVRGSVRGRRLTLDFVSSVGKVSSKGSLWCDAYDGGLSLYGAMRIGKTEKPFVARRAVNHTAKPIPKAGKLVRGIAANGLFYYLRAPVGYKRGTPVPLIVFLHGKGSNSRSYIEALAKDPAIGGRYLLAGIDGELWSDKSEPGEPRNEYTFVEWMGKSALPTAPMHRQQSPALVADLIESLQQRLKIEKTFVGGHSQGGIMSYYLLMHFPQLVAGVFPSAGAVTTQCQPVSFLDDTLKVRQRDVAVAIVHGKKDGAMLFASCEESYSHFADAAFPMLRLFANDGDHDVSTLMVREAIEWLDAVTSESPAQLVEFAKTLKDSGDWRTLVSVVKKLKTLSLSKANGLVTREFEQAILEESEGQAPELLAAISTNTDGAWIDRFLTFRAQFEFTKAAGPVLSAYQKLRLQHEGPAVRLIADAFRELQRGNQKGRWAKYQKIIDKYYASSRYAIVKIWQSHR